MLTFLIQFHYAFLISRQVVTETAGDLENYSTVRIICPSRLNPDILIFLCVYS